MNKILLSLGILSGILSLVLIFGFQYVSGQKNCQKYYKMYETTYSMSGQCYIKIDGKFISENDL